MSSRQPYRKWKLWNENSQYSVTWKDPTTSDRKGTGSCLGHMKVRRRWSFRPPGSLRESLQVSSANEGTKVREDGSTPHDWEPGREQDGTPVLPFRCLGWHEGGVGGDSLRSKQTQGKGWGEKLTLKMGLLAKALSPCQPSAKSFPSICLLGLVSRSEHRFVCSDSCPHCKCPRQNLQPTKNAGHSPQPSCNNGQRPSCTSQAWTTQLWAAARGAMLLVL